MSAIAEAKELYAKHGLCFERDLCHYLQHGIVVAHPDRFLMAKPIRSWIGADDWNPDQPDCWWVQCAIGKKSLKWFMSQSPLKLPMVAFSRLKDKKQRFRLYPIASLERLSK